MPRWPKPPDTSVQKRCSGCHEFLPPSRFYTDNSTFDKLDTYCKVCKDKQNNKWRRKKNPERFKDYNLKTRFGIELGTYDRMFAEQGGVCAICKRPPVGKIRLAVDHCHDTSKVRGLLCMLCNTGIGKFNHDQNLLEAAISYLAKSGGES